MIVRIIIPFLLVIVIGCKSSKPKEKYPADKFKVLHSDSMNVVKLTDSLLIPEGTCRGCAYEGSTRFGITDSMNIIKLDHIVTTDNNPKNMDGGSIGKMLVLVPTKTGITTIKLFKFYEMFQEGEDSSDFRTYTIEVKN